MLNKIDPMLLFGAAGIIGGVVRGGIAYYKAKKSDKIKFDIDRFTDTIVKGAATGVGFGLGLPISYLSLGITALAGAGVDSYLNKFGIKILPTLRKIAKISGKEKKKYKKSKKKSKKPKSKSKKKRK